MPSVPYRMGTHTRRRMSCGERKKLSSKAPLAKAMDYTLKRWAAFTRFLDDGRNCMTNNAAERAVRGIAVGRRNWTFCGSDSGGQRAAVIYTLIETAKLNDVDPRAWLADVLAHIADHPMKCIDELLLEVEGGSRGHQAFSGWQLTADVRAW